MPSFESLRASYRTLWNGMIVNADKSQAAMLAANR
jgi:hypothetical protein